jgi:5-carboxymethyl-2-hydroxymuconate isomerase
MPHIIIEATPRLAAELDFGELLRAVHRELTRAGHTRCEDLKSRVHITDAALTGEDMSGQFLVARLLTTNPRPACARSAMAQIIHDCLRRVVQQKARPY